MAGLKVVGMVDLRVVHSVEHLAEMTDASSVVLLVGLMVVLMVDTKVES